MILVDANNTLIPYAAVQGAATGGFDFNDQALNGFRSAVKKVQNRTGDEEIVLFWDGGHSQRRLKIFEQLREKITEETGETSGLPEYKGGRTKFPGLDEARQELSANLPSLHLPGREADDVIALAVRIRESKDLESCIMSTDRDFYPLCSPVTWIYNRRKNLDITDSALERKLGLASMQQILLVRAFSGDASDGIPPATRGVGKKTALKWVSTSGAQTADELLAHLRFVDSQTAKRARYSGQRLTWNLELMDLSAEAFSEAEGDLVKSVVLPVYT